MDSETISQSSNSFNKISSKHLFIVQSSEEEADNDLIIRDETTRKCYINFSLEKETYRCPYKCGKIFKERGNLRIHIRLHTGEKPFKCTFQNCTKAFISKGKLNAHLNQHLGIKPYSCEYPNCNKRYSGISRLKIHLRTHTGEKPFKCPYPDCEKSFNEKGNLKTHIRIHTGEKPYECSFEGCHKKFKAKGHLTDHMKIHSKIKPFECKICGGKYTRSSTLKIHSYTHLNIKPFKCPYKGCNRGFIEKGNMQIHLKTHYKDQNNAPKKEVSHIQNDKTLHFNVNPSISNICNPNTNEGNKFIIRPNLINNVNVWNCYFPYYPYNYLLANNPLIIAQQINSMSPNEVSSMRLNNDLMNIHSNLNMLNHSSFWNFCLYSNN